MAGYGYCRIRGGLLEIVHFHTHLPASRCDLLQILTPSTACAIQAEPAVWVARGWRYLVTARRPTEWLSEYFRARRTRLLPMLAQVPIGAGRPVCRGDADKFLSTRPRIFLCSNLYI